MYYSITITLPKGLTKQYAASPNVSKNLSTLDNGQILNILNRFANHIALANSLDELIINNEKIIWDPNNIQKQYIYDYYNQNPISFADNKTTPGNNTLDQQTGNEIYTLITTKRFLNINSIISNYNKLQIPPSNCFRHLQENIIFPTYKINNSYITKNTYEKNPTPEIFKNILLDFLNNNWIQKPLSYNSYKNNKAYSKYLLNGIWYELPKYESFTPELLQAFKEVQYQNIPYLELSNFEQNFDAFKAYLELINNVTAANYEDAKKNQPQAYSNNNQIVSFFSNELDGGNYLIPSYKFLSNTLKDIIKEYKIPPTNSIANQVLEEIKNNQKELFNMDNLFETEFLCSRDKRFDKFVSSLQTHEKMNIFNYFFNALKIRNIKQNENNEWNFNLSTLPFQTTPIKDKTEFSVSYNNNVWSCKCNIMQDNDKSSNLIILNRKNFNPKNYKFDAVLSLDNKIISIFEFDGRDHFTPRTNDGSFMQRLTSDQIKSAFAEKEGIPIYRIPDYSKKQKNNEWREKFKLLIIDIINNYQSGNIKLQNYQTDTTKDITNTIKTN